jgi:flagellar motor switch protein FliM
MVVSAPEIVIAVTCAVSIRTDQRMHPIYMVYPYTMIEPLKEKLYAGFISDQLEHDNQWTKRLTDQIVDCPVTLTVQFGTATIRVRDLLNVATGDVLLLDQKPGDPAIGFIEGLRKLTGTVLTSRGVHAFRVTGMIRGVHK